MFSEYKNKNHKKTTRLDFIALDDEEGTTMERHVLESWLPNVMPCFHKNHLYYIQDFKVKNQRYNHRSVDHAYLMWFTMTTKIHQINLLPTTFPLYACNIASFQTLHSRSGNEDFCSGLPFRFIYPDLPEAAVLTEEYRPQL
ncbi:hypothetical protein ACP4OV_023564 [Aristida adscensionis]